MKGKRKTVRWRYGSNMASARTSMWFTAIQRSPNGNIAALNISFVSYVRKREAQRKTAFWRWLIKKQEKESPFEV